MVFKILCYFLFFLMGGRPPENNLLFILYLFSVASGFNTELCQSSLSVLGGSKQSILQTEQSFNFMN